ncbi:MAG TPA: DUF5996 family protein [Ktedonobacteraceae bacterium]|nr:DUF5996 family protein [Ktedonobacteraceae bacterium]
MLELAPVGVTLYKALWTRYAPLQGEQRRRVQQEKDMENLSKTKQGAAAELWPSLPFEAWQDTCETLHMWTQIVGKVRMELSPFVNL